MRISPICLLCLALAFAGCKSAGASKNPLIGTWLSADPAPIPAGCDTKIVFTEQSEYFEDPGVPGLTPPRKGTVHILYGGDPNQDKLIVVENPATMMMSDWQLSDPKHATSGSIMQCHYAKQ